jgi:O-Antigen ligase
LSAARLALGRRGSDLAYGLAAIRWIAAAAIAVADLAIAYAAFDRGALRLILAATVGVEILALCVLRTRTALLVFVGFWGAGHVLLSSGEGQSVGGASASISQLIGVTVLVGFGIAIAHRHSRRGPNPIPFPLRAFAVFGALYTLAELITPLHSAGLSDLVKLLGGLALAFVGYHVIDDERGLLALARAVGAAGTVVASIALAQFASGSGLGLTSYDNASGVYRATSVAGGPNGTADFLLICAGFLLLGYTVRRGRSRARGELGALTIVAMGIVVTFTRADVLALITLVAIWSALWQLRSVGAFGARLRILMVLIAVSVGLMQAVGGAMLLSRAEGRGSRSSEDNLLNGRGAIWTNELHTLSAGNLGTVLIGSGAHTSYTSVFIPQSYKDREFPPHDLFLWLVIETGAVGLAVYVGGLLSLGRTFLRVARRARFTPSGGIAAVALATTVAFTLDSIFHNTQVSAGSDWYFMLFIAVALRMIEPRSWPLTGR